MPVWKFASIGIAVEGGGRIADAIRAELAESLPMSDLPADVTFDFSGPLADGAFRQTGAVAEFADTLRITESGFIVELNKSAPLGHISLRAPSNIHPGKAIASHLRRIKHWNYFDDSQEAAKNFIYRIFDWVTQLALLARGQSYFHASSMERNGRGLAVIGWGGVGKTTAALKLILEDGWKYLSDDLGVIDRNGKLYRSPKRMQIYAYNTEGQPAIARRLLAGRGPIDLANWHCRKAAFGGKRVRRRIGASALLGETAMGCEAELADIIFLERRERGTMVAEPLEPASAAERMAPIVMSELDPYTDIMRQIRANGSNLLPHEEQVESDTRAVLEAAFSERRCHLLGVPENCDPDTLSSRIRPLLT